MLSHIMRAPINLTRLGVQTDDVARIEYHYRTLTKVGHRRYIHVITNTELLQVKGIFLHSARVGIIAIEVAIVGFHPYILARVDMNILGIAGNVMLLHPRSHIIVENLGVGIEDTIVHTLANPDHSVGILVEVVEEVKLERLVGRSLGIE